MEGKLLHALVLLAACGGTEATYKRWTKNTDFGNPSNWNLARLPCSNDRVVFPASSPVVAINQDWTLSNLILANDGIIILGDNVNLQFEENPPPERAECSRPGDIEYNNTLAAHWLDPNNWCIPMHDFDNLCFANIVQTHSEMVPCMTDDILFPGLLRNNHRSSFFINLDIGEDMEIASLKIGMNFLTTDSFQSYLDTDLGRKEFVRGTGLRPPTLSMSGRTCSDPAGCYCGTDQSPYKERICGYAGVCPTVYCDNPITPTGHCCPVCGSKLEMEINRTVYSVFHIRELVQKDFIDHKDKDYSTVRFGMSRLSNGNSQLLMLDNSQGRQSSNMAAEVKSLLDQDMVGEKRYGVLDVSIATSGTPESTPSTTSTTTSPTTASTSTTRVTQPTVTTPQGPTQTSTVTSPSTPPVTHTTPTTQSTSSTTPSPTSTSTSALPPGVTSSTVTPATPEPTSTVAVLGSTAGQRENRTENPVTSETAIIVGSIMAAIVVLLIVVLGLICILGRRTAPSSDPLSLSIKYEDGANGHSSGAAVTFNSVGVENPMFSEETANGVQLTDMTSHDPSVSNIKTSTMKKQKSSKKKSSGFENPIYYSPKTETIGAGADEESHGTNGDITIGNPMYDEGFDGFEDNFM